MRCSFAPRARESESRRDHSERFWPGLGPRFAELGASGPRQASDFSRLKCDSSGASLRREVSVSAAGFSRAIALGVVLTLVPGSRAWAFAFTFRVHQPAQAKAQPEDAAPQPQPAPVNPPAQPANSAPTAESQNPAQPPASAEPAVPAPANSPTELEPAAPEAQSLPPSPQAPPQAAAGPQPAPLGPEPKFRGVGLMILGGLVGSAAVYPAFFGGILWLTIPPGENEQDNVNSSVKESRRVGRNMFLLGAAGLIAAGAMLTGGVILNQRHSAWRERSIRAANRKQARVLPWHQWNGRTNQFGIAARF